MSTQESGLPSITCARVAGGLYLIIIACGIFAEVGVRARLYVAGDASATVSNIQASEWLFRLGFVADSIMLLSDVAIAALLYLLFKPVSHVLSLVAAAFRLTQAAVLGFNLLMYYTAILLLTGEAYQPAFPAERLNTLALLFLDIHSYGYDLGLLFFGVSTVILGTLISRSSQLPTALGYGLIASGIIYLTGSYTRFVAPHYLSLVEPAYIVPLFAELAFCLWLLRTGLRHR